MSVSTARRVSITWTTMGRAGSVPTMPPARQTKLILTMGTGERALTHMRSKSACLLMPVLGVGLGFVMIQLALISHQGNFVMSAFMTMIIGRSSLQGREIINAQSAH